MNNNSTDPSSEAGLGGSVQAKKLVGSHDSPPVSPMTSTSSTEPAQAEPPREGNRPPPTGTNTVTTQPPLGHTSDSSNTQKPDGITLLWLNLSDTLKSVSNCTLEDLKKASKSFDSSTTQKLLTILDNPSKNQPFRKKRI